LFVGVFAAFFKKMSAEIKKEIKGSFPYRKKHFFILNRKTLNAKDG
jgi:hypothetical protein